MTDLLDIDDLIAARPEIEPLTDAERQRLLADVITGTDHQSSAPVEHRRRYRAVLAIAAAATLLIGGFVVVRSVADDGTITTSSEPNDPQITDPQMTAPEVTAPEGTAPLVVDPDVTEVAQTTPTADVAPIDLFAIGDSVMLGAAPVLTERGYTVDADVTRQMQDMIPTMQQLADVGLFGDRVIVHLGTNGPITRDDLESFFATVDDVPNVIVLNVHANRPWTETNNTLLAEFDQPDDNITLIDWNKLADQCVGDCFAEDGIHLNSDGASFYADLIAQQTGH